MLTFLFCDCLLFSDTDCESGCCCLLLNRSNTNTLSIGDSFDCELSILTGFFDDCTEEREFSVLAVPSLTYKINN